MNITISKSKNRFVCTGYMFLCVLSCLIVLWGCATVPRDKNAFANIEGETIDIEDLIYSINISHRIEDMSSAGKLNISGYIQRLIDELLIVQEARRMGMEDYPEISKKVDDFVLRESVVKLHKDEILDKVLVSESEISKRFRHDYERFTFGIIGSVLEEDAAGILERLKAGEDFGELAREHSVDYLRDGGEKTLKRKEMVPLLEKTILDLTAGEISGIVNFGDKFFYILKLIERQDAAQDEYEKAAKNIDKQIRKRKTKERSDAYLKELRVKMNVNIDLELLRSLELDKEESRQKLLEDKRVLVKVNDTVLTAGEFTVRLVPSQINSREKALNNWIDIQVVNREALSRHYELKSDLKGTLRRYKRQILKKLFAKNVIVPMVSISYKEMNDYYVSHKEDFAKPHRYKIQQITLKTRKDALSVMRSLEGGASFSWLAKGRSKDAFASKGGAAGWRIKEELAAAAAEIIDDLKPGEITPVYEVEGLFRIIMLLEKGEPDFETFGAVSQTIQKKIFKEKFDKIYNEYVDRLKKESKVEIYKEVVEVYKAKFRK